MRTEKIISDLVRPLILLGVYKDEAVALKDIVVTHIEKKTENYTNVIQASQEKYKKDFDAFTKDMKNNASSEMEDEWMEWKGAIEMKNAWDKSLKEVMKNETKV